MINLGYLTTLFLVLPSLSSAKSCTVPTLQQLTSSNSYLDSVVYGEIMSTHRESAYKLVLTVSVLCRFKGPATSEIISVETAYFSGRGNCYRNLEKGAKLAFFLTRYEDGSFGYLEYSLPYRERRKCGEEIAESAYCNVRDCDVVFDPLTNRNTQVGLDDKEKDSRTPYSTELQFCPIRIRPRRTEVQFSH
eukprot:sb/3471097/